jgi:hypothetical protein
MRSCCSGCLLSLEWIAIKIHTEVKCIRKDLWVFQRHRNLPGSSCFKYPLNYPLTLTLVCKCHWTGEREIFLYFTRGELGFLFLICICSYPFLHFSSLQIITPFLIFLSLWDVSDIWLTLTTSLFFSGFVLSQRFCNILGQITVMSCSLIHAAAFLAPACYIAIFLAFSVAVMWHWKNHRHS